MKRIFWLFAVLLIASCEQSPVEEQSIIDQPTEFWATFEGADENQTRTYLDEQIRMRWTADDRLTIFMKTTYNREFAFTGKTGANAGGFKQISVDDDFWFGYDLANNYAIYPHSADNAFDETDCFFTTTMPAEQTYVANSFGLGANTMVAASESGQLVFKNVGSYLRVRLWGENQNVKKITLSSIAGEALAGEAKIYASLTEAPTCTMVGTTSSIVLNCSEAVAVNATEDAPVVFWIVLPPVVLAEGYKVVVENEAGKTQEFAVNKEKTFNRNVYNSLTRELTYQEEEPTAPANNEIWYTSTYGAVVAPNNSDVFGATITSNTYENGKGVITFDGDVTIIGESAFETCRTLVNVTLPNSVTEIGRFAFNNCFALTDFDIPSNVNKIDEWAFHYCTNLTSITIPESTTSIGSYAFAYCSSLKEFKGKFAADNGCCLIVNGDLTAFAVGNTLSAYDIPEDVISIGPRAFADCAELAQVTLPTSLKTIGSEAFVDCDKFKALYCKPINPPLSPKMIFYSGLPDCKIYVPAESVAAYKAADGWSEYADAIVGYDFEKGEIVEEVVPAEPANNEIWYTTTNGQAYEYFTIDASDFGANLVSNEYVDGKGILTFDGDVTGIYFQNLKTIETLTLPASVEDGFLRSMTSLKQIVSDLASEDGRCFVVDGAVKGFAPSGLTEYTFPEGVTKIWGGDDGYTYTEVLGGKNSVMKFVLPEGLTEIGRYAFGERTSSGVSSGLVVELPSTLTTIADNAFCVAGLEQITLPANLKTIGKNAFGANSLTSVVIPSSVTSIGGSAFCENSGLSSVTVEATTPCSIGSNVFYLCSSELIINVPSANWEAYAYDDSWGQYAYYMRVDGEVPTFDKITSFQIWYTTSDGNVCQPYDATVFGPTLVSNVYENGKGVMTFNGAVAQIGLCAFYGNTAARQTLTSITIPAFVSRVGEAAIANQAGLTAIYFMSKTPPAGSEDMFLKDDYSIPYDGTIYVPTESVDAYKAAAYWSTYADQIVGYDFE